MMLGDEKREDEKSVFGTDMKQAGAARDVRRACEVGLTSMSWRLINIDRIAI
jgi:hypothetical protein